MTYKETLDFLYQNLPMYQRTGKAAYKADLDNTIELDKFLGHPHRSFKSIHIAGTNGKGSVSHMLASALQHNGFKTGLYTSPHLLDFRERIRVDGKPIPENRVVTFVDSIEEIIPKINPSFFEITVAMAFDHFAKEEVDVAIIETGLGGRLDSTNIITPGLSVITNISMDHMDFLGSEIEQIAAEKAGIIKPGVPVVIGDTDSALLPVFEHIARKKGSPLFKSTDARGFKFLTQSVQGHAIYRFIITADQSEEQWELDLLGEYQKGNLLTTLCVLDLLKREGWSLDNEEIASGLASITKSTGLRGRWEILGANPKIICDTAHNDEGVRAVMTQLLHVPAKKLHIIWGMVDDKAPETILPLLPQDAEYYFTRASIPRALDAKILLEKAAAAGLKGNAFPDVRRAIEAAQQNAETDDVIFIGGSTFVVSDALEVF